MTNIRISIRRVRGTASREWARSISYPVAYNETLDLCRKIMNKATADCPVDTGNLRNHHRMRVIDAGSRVVGKVFNDAKYAAAVEKGSSPHTIRARTRRRPMRFVIGGQVIFARSVRHPGTPPRPWLTQAAERVATSNGWLFHRTNTTT